MVAFNVLEQRAAGGFAEIVSLPLRGREGFADDRRTRTGRGTAVRQSASVQSNFCATCLMASPFIRVMVTTASSSPRSGIMLTAR